MTIDKLLKQKKVPDKKVSEQKKTNYQESLQPLSLHDLYKDMLLGYEYGLRWDPKKLDIITVTRDDLTVIIDELSCHQSSIGFEFFTGSFISDVMMHLLMKGELEKYITITLPKAVHRMGAGIHTITLEIKGDCGYNCAQNAKNAMFIVHGDVTTIGRNENCTFYIYGDVKSHKYYNSNVYLYRNNGWTHL